MISELPQALADQCLQAVPVKPRFSALLKEAVFQAVLPSQLPLAPAWEAEETRYCCFSELLGNDPFFGF